MNSTRALDPRDLEIMRHAIGLRPGEGLVGDPWRNYYCCNVGSETHKRLDRLTAAGYMRAGKVINEGRSQYYVCTPAGIQAARRSAL